jgi:hypothetical protein
MTLSSPAPALRIHSAVPVLEPATWRFSRRTHAAIVLLPTPWSGPTWGSIPHLVQVAIAIALALLARAIMTLRTTKMQHHHRTEATMATTNTFLDCVFAISTGFAASAGWALTKMSALGG